MADQEVEYEGIKAGVVTHFFGKISVAAVLPEIAIKVGDTVKFYDKQGDVVVEQSIESMQIDCEDVTEVKAGEEFGMKVDGVVKDGYLVYKQ